MNEEFIKKYKAKFFICNIAFGVMATPYALMLHNIGKIDYLGASFGYFLFVILYSFLLAKNSTDGSELNKQKYREIFLSLKYAIYIKICMVFLGTLAFTKVVLIAKIAKIFILPEFMSVVKSYDIVINKDIFNITENKISFADSLLISIVNGISLSLLVAIIAMAIFFFRKFFVIGKENKNATAAEAELVAKADIEESEKLNKTEDNNV